MSSKIRAFNRALLNAETNMHCYGRAGAVSVCIVYPNEYKTGMSSLGFQTVYSLFSSNKDIHCERAFLPDSAVMSEYTRSNTPLLSLETSRPLADFDIIAFSTSFEPDYINIPIILNLAGIPLYSVSRTNKHPVVIAGGAAFFINPEPVADFIDVICIGDGEQLVPQLIEALLAPSDDSHGLLDVLGQMPGMYVPRNYQPCYADGRLVRYNAAAGSALPVKRLQAVTGSYTPSSSTIFTEHTEFGDMFLVEVSRGCPRGCRFCSSGFIYGAFRQQHFDALTSLIDEGLQFRSKVGLVGAAVSDYAEIGRLCRYIVDKGAKVSVSSLRIDRINPDMLDALLASGHKTISLAPEGGSQRLRDRIRKNITEKQILEACDHLVSRDILNLKLYFIIGLPGENDEDLDELIRLVEAIREKVLLRAKSNKRIGEIVLSVNPFIPKPFTPFQWFGMEKRNSLEKKVRFLETKIRRLPNVKLKVESLRESYLQALLSRGDRKLSLLLAEMATGAGLKKAAKTCNIDTDFYVYRTIAGDEVMPWSVIDTSDYGHLRSEYEKTSVEENFNP